MAQRYSGGGHKHAAGFRVPHDNALAKLGAQDISDALKLQRMAERIAVSTAPADESELEIAYAIARHLKLEGWPSAYDDKAVTRAPEGTSPDWNTRPIRNAQPLAWR